jgi:hypothetical protein
MTALLILSVIALIIALALEGDEAHDIFGRRK